MRMQFPSDFPISKPCGVIMCPNYYICSSYDNQCHHCYSYCKDTEINYDQEICERQCPEYINDIMGHVVNKRSVNNGHNDIECSPILTTIIVLLFIILFVVIIFAIFYMLKNISKDTSILRFLVGKKKEEDKENELIEKNDTLMGPHTSEPTFASIFGPRTHENSIWSEDEKKVICASITKKKEASYDNLGLQVQIEQKI